MAIEEQSQPAATCRVATSADIEALARLRWKMEVERRSEVGSWEEYFAAFVAATQGEMERGAYRAWIAEVEREPVACVALISWILPPNMHEYQRKRGFITSVYTAPAFRRMGIARRLMEQLIEGARAQGVHRLILWSSDMGQPLYESLGFVPSRGMELNL